MNPVLLLMTFSSLMSNFFYLIWSSLYKPARSSLFTLLALSDLSLAFCGLSLSLFHQNENFLTSSHGNVHPWIFLHFCLSLFFPLLSLVAVVSYLIKEVYITLATEKEAISVDSNIEQMKRKKKGIKTFYFWWYHLVWLVLVLHVCWAWGSMLVIFCLSLQDGQAPFQVSLFSAVLVQVQAGLYRN